MRKIKVLQNLLSNPTVRIKETDAEWKDAYLNWLEGLPPTTSKEWNKGVIYKLQNVRPPQTPLVLEDHFHLPAGWVIRYGHLYYGAEGSVGLYDRDVRVFKFFIHALIISLLHLFICGIPRWHNEYSQ